MRKLIFAGFLLSAFLSHSITRAHGLGESIEATIGDFVIRVEYSESEIVTNEAVRFDFDIDEIKTQKPAEFDSVWIRIAPETEGFHFAGSLAKPFFGSVGMSYTFFDPGNYKLTVRFDKSGEAVAEATFPLGVKASEHVKPARSPFLPFALGAVLGGIAASIFRKKQ